MDRYEFLRTVLPPLEDDSYVGFLAVAGDDKAKWNVQYNTIEELADGSVQKSQAGLIAYYALGTFKDNVIVKGDGKTKIERKASQASRFQTFALDIDAGKADPTKSYPTTQDAVIALTKFIKASGLPVPLVILSGHGIHAYWPLTEPISRDQWRSGGLALKELCRKHDLIIDETKVHDPSMVLRPLDTLNKGNTVQILVLNTQRHSPDSMIAAFGQPARRLPAHTASPLNAAALAGATEYPPSDPAKILAGCATLRFMLREFGAHLDYEGWRLTLGIAKYCINPEATAIEWSKGHKTFNEAVVLEKLESWETPPTLCTTINQNAATNSKCKGCPRWALNGTPCALGFPEPPHISEALPPSPKPAESIPGVHVDPDITAPAIDAPAPFKRTPDGVQWLNQGVWCKICSYDLFPVQIVKDNSTNQVLVEWVWRKPHVGYTRMSVRMAAIFNDSSVVDLSTALSDQGFLVESKLKQQWLSQYMRAYTQLLQQHQASTELYNSFGWKADNSKFVIGASEMTVCNGEVHTHEVGMTKLVSNKNYDLAFGVKGNLETWVAWTELLNHKTLTLHQLELARAFAAPLLPFTGLRGLVVSLVGESGRGKTTIQNWAASVYGDPSRINTTANDTQMSIVQRMGVFNCLPMAVDEVTLSKPETIANLIYWGSQGQDRNRVTEVTSANTWAMILSLSTNRSLRDKVGLVGADVEALQLRLLEFTVPETPIFAETSDWGRRVNLSILDHHGHAGRVYLAHLLSMGQHRIKKAIEDHLPYVKDTYNISFLGKERYWQTAVVLYDLGSKWAHELGLIKYNYRLGIQAMVDSIKTQRVWLDSTKVDPYDLVAEYITVHNGMSTNVVYENGVATSIGLIPRGEVRVRKEFYTVGKDKNNKSKVDRGYAYLDSIHFHQWLSTRGFEFSAVKHVLGEENALFKPGRYGRISFGKDTPVSLPVRNAIGIHLNHTRFRAMLDIQGLIAEKEDNIVDIRGTK